LEAFTCTLITHIYAYTHIMFAKYKMCNWLFLVNDSNSGAWPGFKKKRGGGTSTVAF